MYDVSLRKFDSHIEKLGQLRPQPSQGPGHGTHSTDFRTDFKYIRPKVSIIARINSRARIQSMVTSILIYVNSSPSISSPPALSWQQHP